jgi:hypothetical protein
MIESIFCKTHKCKISVSGCIARHERAKRGRGGWESFNKTKGVPYDEKCADCEQVGEVYKMMDQGTNDSIGVPVFDPGKADRPRQQVADGIPYGYCHCGCGEKTKLNTINGNGYAKGEPKKYLRGHAGRAKKPTDEKTQKAPVVAELYQEKQKCAVRGIEVDFSALSDGQALHGKLKSVAADNLRTIEAQATWELAQILREAIKNH